VADTIPTPSVLRQRPVNRYSVLDSVPTEILVVARSSTRTLAANLDVPATAARRVIDVADSSPRPAAMLASISELDVGARDRVRRGAIFAQDSRLAITDVQPVDGRIMSGRPFALRISFASSALNPPRLVSIRVEWAGEPYVVERLIMPRDLEAGSADLVFSRYQTLPTGPAAFRTTLTNASGSSATFRVTCAVLPSNPFALTLAPNGDLVTGTWSARGVRHGNAYDTGVALTLSNGGGSAVAVRPQFMWKFWGSGVGSYIVEQGTGNFGGNVNVPAFGTWGGWIAFHSPNGSGIFGFYDSKKDMTIEIAMTTTDGRTVSGAITARTMFRFGVNVTAVAGEDFNGQEWSDLVVASEVTRTIYERTDMTFDADYRQIPRARVGGYEVITSFDEFHDLLDDWSGPDSNNNIDAFIVQAIMIGTSGVDGIDGTVPGPTSHHGRDSGVIASKSGYVDTAGQRRLHTEYLGMLLGHELGHYLGLEHTNAAGNLLLPSSSQTDTHLSYDQYKTMIRHGWVEID
jgi:hypothetical protein